MREKLLSALNLARKNRQAAMVVTDLDDGTQGLFFEGDDIAQPEIARQAKLRFQTGKSGIAEVEGQQMFFNACIPSPKMVIIGAVHISQALAPVSQIAGFDVEIIDPRTAFATLERFSGTTLHADWPEDVLANRPLDAYTALVALTHDPKIDDFAILAAIKAGCFYIGALGSRKTHAKRAQRLRDGGLSSRQIDKIHAPIGLDIAAANPAEIAIAIVAQVIESFRRRGQSADPRGGNA